MRYHKEDHLYYLDKAVEDLAVYVYCREHKMPYEVYSKTNSFRWHVMDRFFDPAHIVIERVEKRYPGIWLNPYNREVGATWKDGKWYVSVMIAIYQGQSFMSCRADGQTGELFYHGTLYGREKEEFERLGITQE